MQPSDLTNTPVSGSPDGTDLASQIVSSPDSSTPGLRVQAYQADGAILLAFDLDQALTTGLAGFAIQVTQPDGTTYFLKNRLDFTTQVTSQTAPQNEPSLPSNQAPFQKFHWAFYPHDTTPGPYTFTVTPMYFSDPASFTLKPGAVRTSVTVSLGPLESGSLKLGFTRGFLTSQAYVDKFGQADYLPKRPRTDLFFDTTSLQPQYQWLGATARQMMFDFLQESLDDPSLNVDMFAYDLDEPDLIEMMVKLGPRLRAVLDDSASHVGPSAIEPKALAALKDSTGDSPNSKHITIGHFDRFSHSKVLIQTRDGQPVKVLAGSANFSVRGLYVQANNVFIFNDPNIAKLYEDAFNAAFTSMSKFRKTPISQQWHDVPGTNGPLYSLCFSPHQDYHLSIERVAQAIQNAQSSVLFAVMEIRGGGDVLLDLLHPEQHPNVFFYGITQSDAGVTVYKPNQPNGVLAEFAALDHKVMPPFQKEWNGGMGQVIHHKFVVVDFNGSNPVVFAGSSNLSSGGETDNGDNLVAIYDPLIVEAYAAEAVRLVDHYHFRAVVAQATTPEQALTLAGSQASGQEWWRPYYDPANVKCLERGVFIKK